MILKEDSNVGVGRTTFISFKLHFLCTFSAFLSFFPSRSWHSSFENFSTLVNKEERFFMTW